MLLLIRTMGWFLVMALYLASGWLNPIQVLKTATLGILVILAFSAWTIRKGNEGRFGVAINTLVVFLFFALNGYHAFLRDVFGVAQDDMIVVEALFNTDGGEATEFVIQNSWYLGKHVLLLAVFTLFYWLLLRWRPGRTGSAIPGSNVGSALPGWARKIPAITLSILLLLVHFNPTMRKENPLLYFPIRKMRWEKSVERTRILQEKIAAAVSRDSSLLSMNYTGDQPRTVLFLLGESVARHNWSMYGYPRHTTPQLESLGDELVRFSDIVTTLGSTVGDIRLIMGPATREHPEVYEKKPDLLTMARAAGYKTFWITNHSTDMAGALSIIANNADVTVNTNKGGSRGEGSHDEIVLPELEKALDDPASLKFIVLHLLQAHPAFYFRYPEEFSRYNDVDDEIMAEMLSKGRSLRARKMRNWYDNAMLYVDHVLKATIELSRAHGDQHIAWLYVPDHGEDVAHYTNFVGHNNRVPAMFEIPMLHWRSPSFPSYELAPELLANRPYQTDRLDHTILGLMGIEGEYYDPSADILSPEFKPVPRFIAGRPYRKTEN